MEINDPSAISILLSGKTQKLQAAEHLRVHATSIVTGAIFSPRAHDSIRSRYHPTFVESN